MGCVGEVHPYVSGMGMGEMDAGCGPSWSKGVATGAGQEADCQNSRLVFYQVFWYRAQTMAPAS